MSAAVNDDGKIEAKIEGRVYLRSYLAPLNSILSRPDVTDIYVNRHGELWAETIGGSIERHDAPGLDDATLARLARQIAALSHQILPQAPVAPGLVVGGTDSRSYSEVAENVYRFQPVLFTDDDLETIHGVNEHLSVQNLDRMVRFYIGLMEAGAMQ